MDITDNIPDVRDGLTREERVVLYVLHETQKERGDRNVPTAMLWGRVCEHFYISPEDLSLMLARLGSRKCQLGGRGPHKSRSALRFTSEPGHAVRSALAAR